MDVKYVLYGLRLTAQQLVNQSTGSTFGAIGGETLRRHSLPLAPSGEQKRIVGELEKQFTRLDAAVAGLKRVQTNLKRYRAAVLKAACEGRLVPTEAELARREGRSYEPANELLNRILSERRARWEAAKFAGLGDSAKEPKDSSKHKYREPSVPEVTGLGQLPEGWLWVSLSQIAWGCSYGTSEKCDYKWAGPPVLRIPNIISGEIDLSDLKLASDTTNLNESEALVAHDMLIVRTNGTAYGHAPEYRPRAT